MRLSELRENPKNPSKASEAQLERLAGKLKRVPLGLTAMRIAYVTDDAGGGKMVISGNKRLRVLKKAYGEDAELPDEYFQDVTPMSEAERHEFIVSANVSDGDWDLELLFDQYDPSELKELMDDEYAQELIAEYARQDFGERYKNSTETTQRLADRYVVNPFSVLLTYKGEMAKRKKAWNQIIGSTGESRAGAMADQDANKGYRSLIATGTAAGVSLFNPVIAEISARWFCPENGSIFDCFAGDTNKGLVFNILGHQFTGIELRKEQVDANYKMIEKCSDIIQQNTPIQYFCDDGQNVLEHIEEGSQDMLFSCPPYYDLEVYSDNPNDASNQGTYEEFRTILDNAFTNSVKCLKDNRFAVVVVGDIRDKRGFYYDFPGDVVRIFQKAGAPLYNELILVDPIGNARLKVNGQMVNRKMVKHHQKVLVFYKGDQSKIKENFKPIDYSNDEINRMITEQFEGEDN